MTDQALQPFTGMALDRAMSERSDPAYVRRLLSDPATRAVAAGPDGVLIGDGSGSVPALARIELTSQAAREPVLLGLEDGRALFAVDLDALDADRRQALAAGGEVISVRDAGTVLPHAEAGLAAYLTALLNWHRRHRFCSNCGAGTAIEEAGYSRRCPRCGTQHFPRTDPVVIMAVGHGDRLLLGHRADSPLQFYSVLAGFVAPGESAEEAVIREVVEESGIVARDPRFVSSQPWPFPSSLMLGFEAHSDGGEPHALDGELDDVRWAKVDEVHDALRGRHPTLRVPPPVSIAWFLIDRWAAAHRR
jgi:NAD+ diphosphatase